MQQIFSQAKVEKGDLKMARNFSVCHEGIGYEENNPDPVSVAVLNDAKQGPCKQKLFLYLKESGNLKLIYK